MIGADPLQAMPILDLRLRRAVRHSNLRLVVASERPTALDGGAEETVRYAPGEGAALLEALEAELGADPAPEGPFRADAERLGGGLRPGKTVVIWGERIGRGPSGGAALDALRNVARRARLSEPGAGLISVPDGANARGVREVGVIAGAGPGFAPADRGKSLDEIKEELESGELGAVILVEADPVRTLPDSKGWAKALNQARTVIAISHFDDDSTKAADIVLPAEAYAEKEGTVTHPDGRLQRVRPSVPRAGGVRPIWQVLTRALRRARSRDRHRLARRGPGRDYCRGPLLRQPHARGDRRHGNPVAGTRRRHPPSATRPGVRRRSDGT